MPVRRYQGQGFFGYGVVGQVFSNVDSPVIFDIAAETEEILRPPTQANNPSVIFSHWIINMVWRLKVRILIADLEYLKQYDNPSGKTQFGRYTIGIRDYISDENFISYYNVLSKSYQCKVIWNGEERDDDLPCDEPPISLTAPPLFGAAYSRSSGTGEDLFALNSWEGAIETIGDSVQIYLPPAVQTFTAGVSYAFGIDGFTENDWNLLLQPPIILL